MPSFNNGQAHLHYEEAGDGYPLLVIPGGGLNATIQGLATHAFNPLQVLNDQHRCIAMDLRNADGGRSEGPLEIDRPWDTYADDHIALMDHLGVERFLVLGFCIGGPFIWNLLRKIPNRIAAAVLVHPSGFRADRPDIFYPLNMQGWGPALIGRRDDITETMVDAFLTRMYRTEPDFVFTVSRDFVRSCQTPVLILPDDVPAHPYAVAMETALLAPNAQVSLYPWKEDDQKVQIALRHVRAFLSANCG